MTNASITTDQSTWRREAPNVRSVANSRIRWAIVIESVLAITNAPTKRAIPANASRMYLKNETKLRSFLSSLTWAFVSRTVAVGGSSGLICEMSFALLTPAFDWTRITSSWPGLAKIF